MVHPDEVHNLRIRSCHPLATPAELRAALPLTAPHREAVRASRAAVAQVLQGRDRRLLVIAGPCSIHDPVAALDYAHRLAALAADVADDLVVVMRTYFEKPRTTLGWKGLINDPTLDGSFRVSDGLHTARRILLDIVALGLPVGCEFLDPITPQYLADAVSWGSIGARTAQSQVHRQLASGLSMPIGIKNSTEGDVQAAIDAVAAVRASHVFTGIDDGGGPAIFTTTGNPDGHVVLRGSSRGPNYDAATVADTCQRLRDAALPPYLLVDASHGNSGKDHERQAGVIRELATRLAGGEQGIVGVMLESFLLPGRQALAPGNPSSLVYGRSVTDACMGWDDTLTALKALAGVAGSRASRGR